MHTAHVHTPTHRAHVHMPPTQLVCTLTHIAHHKGTHHTHTCTYTHMCCTLSTRKRTHHIGAHTEPELTHTDSVQESLLLPMARPGSPARLPPAGLPLLLNSSARGRCSGNLWCCDTWAERRSGRATLGVVTVKQSCPLTGRQAPEAALQAVCRPEQGTSETGPWVGAYP